MHRFGRTLGVTLLLCLGGTSAAHASATDSSWYKEPNVNADWTQAYIPEGPNQPILHADVLRPKGSTDADKSPVILSIGPYFGHAGQVGPAGPVEDADYDPLGPPGPSRRFQDFVIGSKMMQKGYTYVMVDLRGFGGSTGCLDWGGPGESADVKAAVEWAASQKWSTGKVGMYGKSYDGVTGLMGIAQQPKGLAAVISQEPVFDLYRYLYSNGVRFENSLATPALYDAIAGTPGQAEDSTDYLSGSVNDTASPGCPATNYADQAANNDHSSAYWKARDLIASTKDKSTPLFLTQGFLENNTKPDGAWDMYNGLTGYKKAWFGMWDHIRGNETAEGSDDTPLWYDDTMHFFDHFLAGAPAADTVDKDPLVRVQTDDGSFRNETAWPPKDSKVLTTTLKTGTYDDDGNTDGAGGGTGGLHGDEPGAEGVWTFSPPLTHDAQFSGVPRVHLELEPVLGAPDVNGSADLTDVNSAVDVYDVDKDGKAILLSRTSALVPTSGKLDLGMYGNDWYIPAGHRIAVLVTDANAEWYEPVPSQDSVTIKSASIDLPFLSYTRTDSYQLKRPERLDTWLADAPFTIPAATITGATSSTFALPAERTAAPAPTTPPTTTTDPGTTPPPATTDPGTTPPPATTTTTTTTPPPGTTPPGTKPPTTKAPDTVGTAPSAFKVSVAVDRTRRATVTSRGLRYRLRCSAACTVKTTLRVDAATAKALHLKSRTVGHSTARLSKAGRTTKRVKLSPAVAQRVMAAKGATLSLVTRVSYTGGKQTVTRKVALV